MWRTPSLQWLLEAQGLSAGDAREGTFHLACTPLLAGALGGSSLPTQAVQQPRLHPPTTTMGRDREGFLTFFPEKRGKTSEFGGHHIIPIAI